MEFFDKKLIRTSSIVLLAGLAIVVIATLPFLDIVGEQPPTLDPYAENIFMDGAELSPPSILLVVADNVENPFGNYLREILHAEGINAFEAMRLEDLEQVALAKYGIVILTEGPLADAQAAMLAAYVQAGGKLVAMRPAEQLSGVLGLTFAGGTLSEGYVITNRQHPLADGIAVEGLQFHGTADRYQVDGAEVIAWLEGVEITPEQVPAVALNHYGDGLAVAWAYDLVKSVAYTRQGNPAWKDQERDDFWTIRTVDMFTGWIDLDRIAIPQADEQQRLLVNVLNFLSRDSMPLVRLWYFPDYANTVLVVTSDAHQNSAQAVEGIISHVEKYGGHISIYYLPPIPGYGRRFVQNVRWWLHDISLMDAAYLPSPSQIADWRARGHEFSLHPATDTENGLAPAWEYYWEGFTGLGYGPISPTTRTHLVQWFGWVTPAELQASYGIRMNTDYYIVGNTFQKENGEWVVGHLTGSGLPMKFVDEDGRILEIYQQATQLADDYMLDLHWGTNVGADAAEAFAYTKALMDASQNGYYTAVTINSHTDLWDVGGEWLEKEQGWLDATLAYAVEIGAPIISTEEWLAFTETRHGTRLSDFEWNVDRGEFRFLIDVPETGDVEVPVMVPVDFDGSMLSEVTIDGDVTKYLDKTVHGIAYAGVIVPDGTHKITVNYRPAE